MKFKNLFLGYSSVILFSVFLLTDAAAFQDPDMGISLFLLIVLLLSNSMGFVAFAFNLSQKKVPTALGIMLSLVALNVAFAFFVKTSFELDPGGLDQVRRFDFGFIGQFAYFLNGLLTLIFMPMTSRHRFFVPSTVLYYALLNFPLNPQMFFLILVILWSVITGDNIYLG